MPNGSAATSRRFSGAGAVAHFGAWETLPFERISPTADDDGPAQRGALAPAGRRGRRPGSGTPGDRRARAGAHPASRPPGAGTRSDDGGPRGQDRSRRTRRLACRSGLSARGSGRAPGRVRGAGFDRGRVLPDPRLAGTYRPVGRRGRSTDDVLDHRSTLGLPDRSREILRLSGAPADAGAVRACRRAPRRRTVGA